jgi:transposase
MQTLFVGIDVSKDSFSVAGLDVQGATAFSLTTGMTRAGFSDLFKAISSHSDALSDAVVAMESSGCYHLNLFSFLSSKGLRTLVINPLVIANFSRLSLRKTKTDRKDAFTIARFILSHRDSVEQFSVLQAHQDLKDLAREREFTLKMISSIKNEIKRLLQSTFPELEHLGNVFSDTMLEFLSVFPSARLITMAEPQAISHAFEQRDKRKRISVPPETIRRAARDSIAAVSPAKEMILPGKIATLRHLEERLAQLTKMLVKLCETTMQEDLKILTSIHGISTITAAPFLAEMGDWRGFRSYKQLIAFAGIDPSIHQSGTIQGVSRLSKRGNRHLRRLIWLMTFCAIRMEGPFKTYFIRRKTEGLPFRKALFATAHKLIRVIFSMLNNRTCFAAQQNA